MPLHAWGKGTAPANQARLERCAAFKSRYKGRGNGAFELDPKRAGYFVENEILVEHVDRDTAERIARDHGGTLITPKALLNAPDGIRRKPDVTHRRLSHASSNSVRPASGASSSDGVPRGGLAVAAVADKISGDGIISLRSTGFSHVLKSIPLLIYYAPLSSRHRIRHT